MKIIVLAGGLSPERNVSLSSGAKVTATLRALGHQAALVDLFLGLEDHAGPLSGIFDSPPPLPPTGIGTQAPDLETVKAARQDKSASIFGPGVLEVCRLADVVFLALHGACGEDGRIQAAFDLMGIPYTGSGYLGSAIAMDKDLTKRLVAHLVNTPPWQTVTLTADNVEAVAAASPLPAVVKPIASGSSIGVSIAETPDQLRAALTAAIGGGPTVIERYIRGREIQLGILEGKALPSIEIIPKEGFYDYENKYQPGAAVEVTPAPIPPETEAQVARDAAAVFAALGLSVYARADFILDGDGVLWFLEINTLPGMTPTSLLPQEAAAAGIDYPQLCERIIASSLDARRQGR